MNLDNCPVCNTTIWDSSSIGMEDENGQRWCIQHHQDHSDFDYPDYLRAEISIDGAKDIEKEYIAYKDNDGDVWGANW